VLTLHDKEVQSCYPKSTRRVIFVGDFNATLHSEDIVKYTDAKEIQSPTRNTAALKSFIKRHGYKRSKQFEVGSSPFHVKSLIDFVLVPESALDQIERIAIEDRNTDSDHLCVAISVKVTKRKTARKAPSSKKDRLKTKPKIASPGKIYGTLKKKLGTVKPPKAIVNLDSRKNN